jgi:hypothetical protein
MARATSQNTKKKIHRETKNLGQKKDKTSIQIKHIIIIIIIIYSSDPPCMTSLIIDRCMRLDAHLLHLAIRTSSSVQ